jgi:hypothetical protein
MCLSVKCGFEADQAFFKFIYEFYLVNPGDYAHQSVTQLTRFN